MTPEGRDRKNKATQEKECGRREYLLKVTSKRFLGSRLEIERALKRKGGLGGKKEGAISLNRQAEQ